MNKAEIIHHLTNNYQSFTSKILSLQEDEFLFTVNDKWTAGQNAEHILRAVKPVNLAFGLPLFVPKLLFGKSNRPSKSYQGLVEKYKNKLAEGGKASGRYIPPAVVYSQQQNICKQITAVVDSLCKRVNNKTEDDLDVYILPHPLMGKLTLREMLYFTIYHAEHHLGSMEELMKFSLSK